jgi:hypothetical protein
MYRCYWRFVEKFRSPELRCAQRRHTARTSTHTTYHTQHLPPIKENGSEERADGDNKRPHLDFSRTCSSRPW